MELEENVSRQTIETLDDYKVLDNIEQIPIDVLRAMYKDILENSIPTKKIEDKIRELKTGINNCDRYNNYSEYDIVLQEIKFLQKLMEDKK